MLSDTFSVIFKHREFLMIFIEKRVGFFAKFLYEIGNARRTRGWSFFKRENLGCHKKQFTSFFLFLCSSFFREEEEK